MSRPSSQYPHSALLDLVAVVFVAAVLSVESLTGQRVVPGPVQVALGFVFVFFVPGYALTAALYPAVSDPLDRGTPGTEDKLVDGLVFPVGLSIALVPLVGLLIHFSPGPVERSSLIVALSVLVVLLTLVAGVRRSRAPPARRAGLPYGRAIERVRSGLSRQFHGGPTVAGLVVGCCLLAAVFAGAALAFQDGEQYTELYLLGDGDDGEMTGADNYPTEFVTGEPESLVVGVKNNEGTRTRYTVTVELHQFESVAGERRVSHRTRVDEFALTLVDGERRDLRRSVTIDSVPTPTRQRLTVRLYRGDAPAVGAEREPYRQAHYWVNVTSATPGDAALDPRTGEHAVGTRGENT